MLLETIKFIDTMVARGYTHARQAAIVLSSRMESQAIEQENIALFCMNWNGLLCKIIKYRVFIHPGTSVIWSSNKR